MRQRIAMKFHAGLCAVVMAAVPLGVLAQTTQAPAPQTVAKPAETKATTAAPIQAPAASGAEEVTDVTVFLKKKSSIPEQNMRIDTRRASSCGFFGSDGSADYIADYIRDTTGSYDANDPNNFSENSPLGDASREGGSTIFDQQERGTDESGAETGSSGCTATDRKFAAGRATIARNDKTIYQAFDFYDQKKYPEALEMFKTAYTKIGYEDAAFYIARMYLEGLGTPRNPKEAIVWFRKVAEQPVDLSKPHPFDPKDPEYMNSRAEATMTLAKIYLTGYGVPRDQKEALKWFEKAASIGFIPASKIVGDVYYYGNGVPKDLNKAFRNYSEAAKFGYAPAQYAVAQILEFGEGDIKADPQKALGWYSEAAKVKHPGALYAIAVAYDSGEGVAADPQKALVFYKEAAVGGNPDAQNAIGTYFYQGGLLPKDEVAARQWFEVAALNGQADAAFNLAVMYMKGEGGPKDVVKAYVWFAAARVKGHENAAAAMKAAQAQMTDAQKAEVETLFAPKK
ncbi:SEL1-like repeat protein [Asticcacaulis sp. AND118]|uniref:SEL1-like repeat protein n=1 Tax=Asticcacaulis sp. AND118 TaxID=2840468 RepID=UPI001D000377|nr:SEL1-like repeat protein [Asticcacaulis sp. AND118]UDF04138.1 SEL1-like repeat protein [Asticcacaulis sp. AND118]